MQRAREDQALEDGLPRRYVRDPTRFSRMFERAERYAIVILYAASLFGFSYFNARPNTHADPYRDFAYSLQPSVSAPAMPSLQPVLQPVARTDVMDGYERIAITEEDRRLPPWRWAQQRLGTSDAGILHAYISIITRENPQLRRNDLGAMVDGVYTLGVRDGLFDDWSSVTEIIAPTDFNAPPEGWLVRESASPRLLSVDYSVNNGVPHMTMTFEGRLADTDSSATRVTSSYTPADSASSMITHVQKTTDSTATEKAQDRDLDSHYHSAFGSSHTEVMGRYNSLVSHGVTSEEAYRRAIDVSSAAWNAISAIRRN